MIRPVERTEFRAMGTTVAIVGVGVPATAFAATAADARRRAEAWEAAFSRFRPESDLSRLNAAAGRPVRVPAVVLDVIAAAVEGAKNSGGRFDPTVLTALEAAGYDRDFASLRGRTEEIDPVPVPGVDGIEIDRQQSEVRLSLGTRLDLGGIAKGAFVDHLAAELSAWPGGCVDAGGDLRVWGMPPSGAWWCVGVENPTRPADDLLLIQLTDPAAFAVATSGVHRRCWTVPAGEAHHLIDPATGRPLATHTRSVTAVAATATAAEVAAKALIVAAARGEPLSLLDATAAIVVSAEGRYLVIGGKTSDACLFFASDDRRQSA